MSASTRRLLFWAVFYLGVLPVVLPACLDWLNRPSDTWVAAGLLGLAGLLLLVATSVYQAGRALLRRLPR